MALVLRKAVLPKNVSLLKCFKGRPLATAANKKNTAALSTAVPCRSLRDNARMLPAGTVKIEKAKQLPTVRAGRCRSKSISLRYCVSCPDIVPASRMKHCAPARHLSPGPRSLSHVMTAPLSCVAGSPAHLQHQIHSIATRSYAKSCPCGCPCPFPCGPCGCAAGCGCLPPPCNQPPKCIQYMTGYYYYPYGFWFCGPYHVTGTCCPVGPCGPCPSSCPACPCAKCCACFSPVAAAVVGSGPQPPPFPPQTGVSRPPSKPITPSDIKYPLPPQENVQCSASRTGVSKFFPFNSGVPSMDNSMRPLPQNAVMMCPYSTKSFPEKKPVYYTPCVKQTKNNYSTRPRQPFTYNNPKPKKSVPNSLSKAFSDHNEKRTESRSPIHHKRSKKFSCEVCPLLDHPRTLMTQEQRDRPQVHPGAFQYSNIPNYRSPYPQRPRNDPIFQA